MRRLRARRRAQHQHFHNFRLNQRSQYEQRRRPGHPPAAICQPACRATYPQRVNRSERRRIDAARRGLRRGD
jgi:hypothetical protein